MLVTTARRVWKRLRRPGPPRPSDDDDAGPEGEPIPWQLRLLFALVVLAALAAAFYVLSSLTPPAAPTPPPPELDPHQRRVADLGRSGHPNQLDRAGTRRPDAGGQRAGHPLGGAARAGPADEEDLDEAQPQQDEVDLLVAAVDAADEGLHRHADPRAAVLAAYAAMAGQLSGGLVRRGRAARRSDTATELLDRAVAAGLVDGAPARTLTELFHEARFSEHPMGEEARRSALDCLARVRGELAARRG